MMYAITGSSFILSHLSGSDKAVTDATGAVWRTANIHETAAIVSLFTMLFIAALAAVKLMRRPRLLAGETSAIGAANTHGAHGASDATEAAIAENAR